jgi:hypothetical protein
MTDKTADVARLMKVTEAVCEELHRQGFSELLADGGFDVAGPSGHQGGRRRRGRVPPKVS